MVFYRVKEKFDRAYKNPKIYDGNIYVKNELYTEKEIEKQGLNKQYMEKINASKKNTYWFFSARFLMKKGEGK